MSRFGRFLAVVSLIFALPRNARAAEHDWPAGFSLAETTPRLSLWVSNRAGLAQAPFFTPAFPNVSGFASVLTLGAAVRLSSLQCLRLRLPVTVARLDFPARAQVAETALGNVELAFEQTVALPTATRIGLVGALVIPSASHGPAQALLDNRVLALGNAVNGVQDSALMTPGVSGVRLAGSFEHWHEPFELRARFELPLLVRISTASLPTEAKTQTIGILPSLELRAAVWLARWFGASLGAALVTEPFRLQEPTREGERERRVQVLVEPAFFFRVGQHVTLGLDGSVPVGGNLGGKAWGVGTLARFSL